MGNEKSCSMTCCIFSFLIGAAVGGGITLVITPQAGRMTRKQLKIMAGDAKEKIADYYDEVKDRGSEAAEKAQGFYQEAKRKVESTVDSAKNTFLKE